jgi:hypothetical protein
VSRVLFSVNPKGSLTPAPKSVSTILSRNDLNLDSPSCKFKYKNFLRDIKELDEANFIDQLKWGLK